MDIKILIIAGTLVFLALVFLHFKRRALQPFLLALAVAFLWTTYYRYEYIGENIFLFNRVNIYPFILWTAGLTLLGAVDIRLNPRAGWAAKSVVYFAALAVLETIGYHWLNVRLASNYTSLLDLGIIHAPPAMKAFYVLAGPVFVAVLDWRKPRAI